MEVLFFLIYTSTFDRNGLSTSAELTGVSIATNGPNGFQMDEINFAEQNINAAQDQTQDNQPNRDTTDADPTRKQEADADNDFFRDMGEAGVAIAGLLAGGAGLVSGLFGGGAGGATTGGNANPLPSNPGIVATDDPVRRREDEEGGEGDPNTEPNLDSKIQDVWDGNLQIIGELVSDDGIPYVRLSDGTLVSQNDYLAYTNRHSNGETILTGAQTGDRGGESGAKDYPLLPKTVQTTVTEYRFSRVQDELLGRLLVDVAIGDVKNPETIKALDEFKLKLDKKAEQLYQAEGLFEYHYKSIGEKIARLQSQGYSDSDIAKIVSEERQKLVAESNKIVSMKKDFEKLQRTTERDMLIAKIGELGINGQTVDLSNPGIRSALNKLLDSSQPERMRGAAADYLIKQKINLGSGFSDLRVDKLVDLPTNFPNLLPGQGYTRTNEIGGYVLKMPGDPSATVTDELGQRTDPVSHEQRFHSGFDTASKLGTPIGTPADGSVLRITGLDKDKNPITQSTPFDASNPYGLRVEVQIGNSNYGYAISHNSAVLVSVGDPVKAGQAISLSGNSGKSAGYSGEHVHAEILKRDSEGNWGILIPTKEDLIELEKLGVAHAK